MEERIYFRSEYRIDLPTYKEFNQIAYNSMGSTGMMHCISACCVLYLILANVGRLATILLLILGLTYLANGLFRWNISRNGGAGYQQILNRNEGKPPLQIITLDETCIRGYNPVTENQISDVYESFRTIMETQNLLVLVTRDKTCHILDKRTLTGGSREELIAFLRSRCPMLRKTIQTGRFSRISRYLLMGVVALGVVLGIISLLPIG